MIKYISDTHLGHANIIGYCERPFETVHAMDRALMDAMLEAEAEGAVLYHLGDLAFKPEQTLPRLGRLTTPERHTLIAGNHDEVKKQREDIQHAYRRFFRTIIGTEKTWKANRLVVEDTLRGRPVRVLLSHAPQRDLGDAEVNLYGHCHNNNVRNPERFRQEYPWLAEGSPRHLNISVELTGYRPLTLDEIVDRREAGEVML